MTIRRATFMLAVTMILVLTTHAQAEGIPETVKQQLGRLVGKWTIDSRVGDTTTAQARLSSQWSPNEDCVIWHWSGKGPVTGNSSTMSGMLGWDGHKNRVFERGFSSDGQTFTASHDISEKEWLSPTKGTQLMDGSFKEETSLRTFEWKSDDELTITSRNRELDGEPQSDVVAVFQRVK
jgi:hypothetical protein